MNALELYVTLITKLLLFDLVPFCRPEERDLKQLYKCAMDTDLKDKYLECLVTIAQQDKFVSNMNS